MTVESVGTVTATDATHNDTTNAKHMTHRSRADAPVITTTVLAFIVAGMILDVVIMVVILRFLVTSENGLGDKGRRGLTHVRSE